MTVNAEWLYIIFLTLRLFLHCSRTEAAIEASEYHKPDLPVRQILCTNLGHGNLPAHSKPTALYFNCLLNSSKTPIFWIAHFVTGSWSCLTLTNGLLALFVKIEPIVSITLQRIIISLLSGAVESLKTGSDELN